MNSVCIVTDSAAQFPQLTYNGRNLLKVVPFCSQISEQMYVSGEEFKAVNLPQYANDSVHPSLIAPTVQQFRETFSELASAVS
jgi:fatty acid-binding protein DegV